MFFLVRKSVLGSQDEFQDLDFEVDELTLGSAPRNIVVLEGLLAGSINLRVVNKGKARFKCTEQLFITENNRILTSGVLQQGKIYQLDNFDIEIINCPVGFDFAISITQSARKPKGRADQYRIKQPQSRFSLRSLSYLSFVGIMVVFLIVPLYAPDSWFSQQIITDNSWSSGPLAMAHRIPEIGNNCKTCHVKPFAKVADEQCLGCHRNLPGHVANNHPAVDELNQFLCENCHKEHNEPAQLTRTDDGLCIACHKKINQLGDATESSNDIKEVTGFDLDTHPQFKLSLIQPYLQNGVYQWRNKRVRPEPDRDIVENSNLKFSHKVHLDIEMVQDELTGESLNCDSCHQLKDDGEHFRPINMDNDCRSCHQLNFDVFNPDLELPHGDLKAAIVMLQAHYIREFTDPKLRLKRSRKKIRRIPGKHSNNGSCEGSGLNCGRVEALKEAEFQFNNSGCITCHEVTENQTTELLDKWFVKPIKVNDDWYAKARFDHNSHFSVKSNDRQEICLSCHDVQFSDDSEDIAMPKQEVCLECHQQGKTNNVELRCIRCHVFHFTDLKNKTNHHVTQ